MTPAPPPALPTTMRALVYDGYGGLDVLAFRDLPVPAPGPRDVLVRVRAAALNPKDSLVRKGRFRVLSGWRFPKHVGVDFAGEVAAVGSRVTGLVAGERVYGMLEEVTYARGTLAEYVLARDVEVAPMPSTLRFDEAAALPLVALTALQALRDRAGMRPGDAVCIHGASGGVGTAAIQMATALGGVVTTASSAKNRDLCRSLGATEALDYASDRAFDGTRRFRIVLDAFGNLSLAEVERALTSDGTYVTTVPSRRIVIDALRTVRRTPRARLVVVRARRADFAALSAFVDSGRVHPVIDRVVPFADAVDAVRHLETKRTRGKIVVHLA